MVLMPNRVTTTATLNFMQKKAMSIPLKYRYKRQVLSTKNGVANRQPTW
jgi:hypothetical protein